MRLPQRILKLEQRQGAANRVQSIAIEIPGSPDLMLCAGQWKEIPDGVAVLRAHPRQPIKVYRGFDVRAVP
jgi:hypothetical protein